MNKSSSSYLSVVEGEEHAAQELIAGTKLHFKIWGETRPLNASWPPQRAYHRVLADGYMVLLYKKV